MASSSTFTGIGLSIQTVTSINRGRTVRVRFTNEPKQISTSASDDGLNVANYTLTGPGFANITNCTTVGGDTQSIDLHLASPLFGGEWLLTIANIKSSTGVLCVAPLSGFFTVIANSQLAINSGVEDSEKIIRKHLNPALAGENWTALIAALSVGDEHNFNNAKLAFDQLYKTSASGRFLDRLAANDGIARPANVGLTDEIFRQYAIKLSNKKVVNQSVLEMLEVFYGTESTRAHATTDLYEPFVLADGDDLNITIDGFLKYKVVFKSSDFLNIAQARAVEVASAITRTFLLNGSKAFAVPFTDYQGLTKVRIYSPSLGLKGSVQIRGSGGGKAQNSLGFETRLGDVYTGTIVPNPSGPDIPLGVSCVIPQASMLVPSRAATSPIAAKLGDGRIVVAGGYNFGNGSANFGLDIWSADGLTKTIGPDFPYTQLPLHAVSLGNGSVLFVTNENNNFPSQASTLSTGLTFTTRPTVNLLFNECASVSLPNGNALFIGAIDNVDYTSVVEYDYNTNTWISRTPIPGILANRRIANATVMKNGNVLLTGGQSTTDSSYPSTHYIYNPTTFVWTTVANSMPGRTFHSVGNFEDGRVLIVGGQNQSGFLKDVWEYDPNTNLFTQKEDFPSEYYGLAGPVHKLDNNYMVLVGGYSSSVSGGTKSVWTYNPNQDTWAETTDVLNVGRYVHQSIYQGGCKFFVVGGARESYGNVLSAEFINLDAAAPYVSPEKTFSWAAGGTLSAARAFPSSIKMDSESKILVVGGQNANDLTFSSVSNAVDVVTISSGASSAGANLPWSASRVSLAQLTDGNVLAWGGQTTTGTVNKTAIYDVAGNTWTQLSADALELDYEPGSHAYVTDGVSGSLGIQGTSDFTIKFTMKRDAAPDPTTLSILNKTGVVDGWSIFLQNNEIVAVIGDPTSPVVVGPTTGGLVNDVKFHTIEFGRRSGDFYIKIDGIVCATLTDSISITASTETLFVGHRPSSRPFEEDANPSTLFTGLKAFWKLDGDATDYTGNNDAVATNCTFSAGVCDESIELTGLTSTVVAPPNDLDIMTDLTISCWVRPTAHANYYTIVAHMLGGGWLDTNYHLIMLPSGHIALFGRADTGVSAGAPAHLNTWTHVVATRTTSGYTEMWYNGTKINTGTGPVPNSVPTASTRIGCREDAYDYFHGKIDEVGIWNRVLTDDEIATLYGGAQFSAFGGQFKNITIQSDTALEAKWSLNLTTTDSSGNSKDLNKTGSSSYQSDDILPQDISDNSIHVTSDGRIFSVGGKTSAGTAIRTVFEFNETDSIWEVRNALNVARAGHTFATLPFRGNISLTMGEAFVVMGGFNNSTPVTSIEHYNLAQDSWTTQPVGIGAANMWRLQSAISSDSIIWCGNGKTDLVDSAYQNLKYYVAYGNVFPTGTTISHVAKNGKMLNIDNGGILSMSDSSSSLILDPVTRQTFATTFPSGASSPALASFAMEYGASKVLLIGGLKNDGTPLNTIWIGS